MTIPLSRCFICTHYGANQRCSAYPKGIPDVIYLGEIDHRKPFKGDHGIQYKKSKSIGANK